MWTWGDWKPCETSNRFPCLSQHRNAVTTSGEYGSCLAARHQVNETNRKKKKNHSIPYEKKAMQTNTLPHWNCRMSTHQMDFASDTRTAISSLFKKHHGPFFFPQKFKWIRNYTENPTNVFQVSCLTEHNLFYHISEARQTLWR